jgi:hypothetical protein
MLCRGNNWSHHTICIRNLQRAVRCGCGRGRELRVQIVRSCLPTAAEAATTATTAAGAETARARGLDAARGEEAGFQRREHSARLLLVLLLLLLLVSASASWLLVPAPWLLLLLLL